MSLPRRDKASLPDPRYHWTTLKAQVFLDALARRGRVSEATHIVGMSRTAAYALRARLGEGSRFAQAWDRALEEGRAKRRARPRPSRKAAVLAPEDDVFGLGR